METPRPTTVSAVDSRDRRAAASRSISKAVDELGVIAKDMELINRLERTGEGSVKIALSSCEAELYEEEAAAYLADCVLNKLKTMLSEARLSTTIRSGAWTPDRHSQPALPDN